MGDTDNTTKGANAPIVLAYARGPRPWHQRRGLKVAAAVALLVGGYGTLYAVCWARRNPAANLMYFTYTSGNRSEIAAFVGLYPAYFVHKHTMLWWKGRYGFGKHNWDRGGMTWQDTFECIRGAWSEGAEEETADDGSDTATAPDTTASAPTATTGPQRQDAATKPGGWTGIR